MVMAQDCGYTNAHGVQCGLKPGHDGDHEPCEQLVAPDPFCLRATDPFTLATIRAWICAAKAHGVSESKIQKAEAHFNEIKRWQTAHGTRLPD
jgi:hypothetical protein